MTIQDKLNQLANYRAQVDALNLQKQDEIDKILTPEVKNALAEIELEFGDKAEGASDNISALEKEIKAAVINHGATVKSEFLMAVYNKGRVSWDSKGLAGFAVAHPEIEAFKKTGNPSVTLRTR